jgi:hypothetical protein
MYVRVAELFENGRPLPRHRSVRAQPVHVGQLTLTENYDKDCRRSVTYAVLLRIATGSEVLPRLRDAVVRWIGEDCMTISGYQLDDTTRYCSAQSWYIQLVKDDVT